ncbi:MAG: response regulator [Terriglobales bacterium]
MSPVALVVDDSMLIRHTVCRYLEQRGFAVESATNGVEALAMLKTVLPDVIITDLMMPKMDGKEFIAALRAMPQTAGIPVVILAGKGNPDGDQSGANFVIFKDIGIEAQLHKALLAALGPDAMDN